MPEPVESDEPIDEEITDAAEELFGEGADHRQFAIKRDVRRRVDRYLLDRLKGISRTRIQKLIDLGGVKVNGRQPKASTLVLKGDVIDVILPAPAIRTIEPEDIPLDVLYEDDHFIVLNKQAGIIIHPARTHIAGTLLNALAFHFKKQQEAAGHTFKAHATRGFRKRGNERIVPPVPPVPPAPPVSGRAESARPTRAADDATDVPRSTHPDDGPPVTVDGLSHVGARECRPGIIHRLDKYTTGVIVVAKDDEAHWGIAKQFEDRSTTKAYLALVHGNFADSEISGVIDEPIGKHPTIREAVAIRRDSHGRASITIYRVREQYKGYSLVELHLRTGRTHQIRVHMGYLGYPIAGDVVYGGEPVGEREIESPPIAAGSRKFLTYARDREEGLRIEAEAEAREDMIMPVPALHATLLSFRHPITEQIVRFTAPLHDPMRSLVKRLREGGTQGRSVKDGCLIDLAEAIP
ncbi:MAG: pseudouridine synthase [Phycisphaeraceae bacterium]